ncbi:uncharacterized protein GIQ15_04800 [Arthroderma uncinatum]|uniref:uncharacterized protein n=1 Tax=Arthroderma uncinatum TaxID=74035 RepID=UPI00144ABF8D|nr:uncharacterized protein GIQ15_04800 [Arthroderma uncinatum]KAF3482041.1 hypothetical protein GIQ15_04800 [Arthroderma uncinatum]
MLANSEQLKQRLRERANMRSGGYGGQGGRGGYGGNNRSGVSSTRGGRGQSTSRRDRYRSAPRNDAGGEISASVKAYQKEMKEKQKRKPVRYNPEPYTVEKLKETWPALAIDGLTNTSTIREKLSWFGDKYVGAVDLPDDLAKRFYKGERVLFSSETEKAETMEIVKKMAEEHAGRLTERKGEPTEAPSIEFENVNEKEKSDMIASLIRGEYEDPAKVDSQMAPFLTNVMKTLADNHTYHTSHTQRFMDSLVKNLPPLKKPKAAATASAP